MFVFGLINHCNLFFSLFIAYIVSLLCSIDARSLHCFLVFLLMFFNTSLLWFVDIFQCILPMLYWWFLVRFHFALLVFIDNLCYYGLLVFVGASMFYYVGVHQHFLCRNLSLWLVTKARTCKGASQE